MCRPVVASGKDADEPPAASTTLRNYAHNIHSYDRIMSTPNGNVGNADVSASESRCWNKTVTLPPRSAAPTTSQSSSRARQNQNVTVARPQRAAPRSSWTELRAVHRRFGACADLDRAHGAGGCASARPRGGPAHAAARRRLHNLMVQPVCHRLRERHNPRANRLFAARSSRIIRAIRAAPDRRWSTMQTVALRRCSRAARTRAVVRHRQAPCERLFRLADTHPSPQ